MTLATTLLLIIYMYLYFITTNNRLQLFKIIINIVPSGWHSCESKVIPLFGISGSSLDNSWSYSLPPHRAQGWRRPLRGASGFHVRNISTVPLFGVRFVYFSGLMPLCFLEILTQIFTAAVCSGRAKCTSPLAWISFK